MKAITWNEFWTALVAVAGVVAAVVGFVVHAISVKKSALEIKKLRMEIAKQQRDAKREDSLIQIASFEQTKLYSNKTEEAAELRSPPRFHWSLRIVIGIAIGLALVVGVLWATNH